MNEWTAGPTKSAREPGEFSITMPALKPGSYSIDPQVGAPASLPWFFPGANGIVRRLDEGTYQVTVLSDELKLAQLRIADAPPARDVSLATGQSLTVHAEGALTAK